eukprot:TRINITY_DN13343_c0_g1_i2.p1 TRINITY_DN13343_c0_g1~~TRINITY_DN13343_c0_g1_i2.p1  ORF type:complete len:204 (+),score=29.10 TRINITY_DN13343_c0_g1_i2:439-1050(+)
MMEEFHRREGDSVVIGKWSDPSFLQDNVYDVVVADYLLGAVEGFDPYFQDQMLPRLKKQMKPGSRLFFVGLEPHPASSPTKQGQVIIDIARTRDACCLLAGKRPYREYPMEWVVSHLKAAGFVVTAVKMVPIRQSHDFVSRQLRVARRFLEKGRDSTSLPWETRKALNAQIDNLYWQVGKLSWSGVYFGNDYAIAAVWPLESE